MKWALSCIQFNNWLFTCSCLYVISDQLNSCSCYVKDHFCMRCFFLLNVKWLLSYIHFIDLFSFSLICMLSFFIWFFLASMSCTVLRRVIMLYYCQMFEIIYRVHSLILYLLNFVCFFFFISIIDDCMFMPDIMIIDFF